MKHLEKCNWMTRLNAYIGYVVPIATYALQAWLPNKAGMQDFEGVQQIATKWIFESLRPYKDSLKRGPTFQPGV